VGDTVDVLTLRSNLGATIVEEGGIGDLPWPFGGGAAHVPPLGRMFGTPVFVDEKVSNASVICFAVFAATDLVEMLYDDFARLEQPRVTEFVRAGELPPPPVH
jgi:hypothetical protein